MGCLKLTYYKSDSFQKVVPSDLKINVKDYAGGYRYSFQGQEHDDEIKGKGNSVNYQYRMHDPRLGRFFAVDPLAYNYPFNSSYAFSENRVIDAVELEGLESKPLNDPKHSCVNVPYKPSSTSSVGNDFDKEEFVQGLVNTGATMLVVAVDVYVTKGWLSRVFFLHELGSEMNATDNYHEAKINGNEKSAAEHKQRMEAHGLGATLGAVAEIAPSAFASTMRYARESLAIKWMGSVSKTKYIDFNKAVYTTTVKKGTELVQFRVQGTEGTIGNYFAPVGTKPAQIGLDPNKVVETLNLTVTVDTKVLVSTHIKNASYYADKSVILDGGGQQYFSKSLKENVTKTNP